MASIHERKGKRKTTFSVQFRLYKDGKILKQIRRTFNCKSDAKTFLSIATQIESKCKMKIAPPEEVELWVKQGHLSMEQAV